MQPRQPFLPNLPIGATHALGFLCALVVVALSYGAVYRPLAEWRKGVAERAELVKVKLTEGQTIRQQHSESKQELQNLLASVKEVNRRAPDQPREGEFLGDISRLAIAHDVQINDFRRGTVSENATYSSVSILVTGEATHEGLCELLEEVSQLPRLASLTRLRVTPGNSSHAYPIELHYSLYYGMTPTE